MVQQLTAVGTAIILFIAIMVLGTSLVVIASGQATTIAQGISGTNTTPLTQVANQGNSMLNTTMQLGTLVVLAALFGTALVYFLGIFGGRTRGV